MKTPKQQYYETLAATIIKGLEKRGMNGCYYATKEEAVSAALDMIQPDSTVTWGGSETVGQIGLVNALKEKNNCRLLDRAAAKTPDEKKEIQRKSFFADYYLMSTNAITTDGILVNIDGNGNRVAALICGPDRVLIFAGMNKVASDTDTAIARIHTAAAPPNAARLGLSTPCAKTGVCHNCLSPDCICAHTVITRYNRIPGRIQVFLIGEELGF